jgi:hypothetical protein
MSIIYEALKKVSRKDNDASHNEPNPPPMPTSSSALIKSAAKNKLALALAGITMGILVTWLIMNKLTATATFQKIQTAKKNSSAALLNNPAASPIKEARHEDADGPAALSANEKLPAPEAPELILNGIALSADGNLALINGEILQAGDDIGGAKVREITDKQVTLTFRNEEIILKKK